MHIPAMLKNHMYFSFHVNATDGGNSNRQRSRQNQKWWILLKEIYWIDGSFYIIRIGLIGYYYYYHLRFQLHYFVQFDPVRREGSSQQPAAVVRINRRPKKEEVRQTLFDRSL